MRRGFTLIELMIGVAILAIMMAVPLASWDTLGSLMREQDYRLAARTAQLQVELLREAPLASLPPRQLKVPASGLLDLGVDNLVEGSVTLRKPDGTPLGAPQRVDLGTGRVQVERGLAGREVVVNYRFGGVTGAGHGEAYTVDPEGNVRLQNVPVNRVIRVTLAQGERLSPVPSWRLVDPTQGLLQVPGEAGRVVLVDYGGQRLNMEVSGDFRGELLEAQTTPSPFKLLQVTVTYAGGARKVSLSVLRVPQ